MKRDKQRRPGRSGEGRSSGWLIQSVAQTSFDVRVSERPRHVNAPNYPRPRVRVECTEAVEGVVLLADTVRWQGVRGKVAVRGDALIAGERPSRPTHSPARRSRAALPKVADDAGAHGPATRTTTPIVPIMS